MHGYLYDACISHSTLNQIFHENYLLVKIPMQEINALNTVSRRTQNYDHTLSVNSTLHVFRHSLYQQKIHGIWLSLLTKIRIVVCMCGLVQGLSYSLFPSPRPAVQLQPFPCYFMPCFSSVFFMCILETRSKCGLYRCMSTTVLKKHALSVYCMGSCKEVRVRNHQHSEREHSNCKNIIDIF
jgi:hypothetical protein